MPPPEWVPPSGICECGCGGKTGLVRLSNKERGIWAGYPRRFIHNHHRVGITGKDHPRWKGGRVDDGQGHVLIRVKGGYKPEHRIVWEAANGPPPKGHHIHHKNGIPDDNRLENLVCLSPAAHKYVHQHTEGAHAEFVDDDLMVEAFAVLWKKLGRSPITRELGKVNATPHWATYIKRFGSIRAVRKLAESKLSH